MQSLDNRNNNHSTVILLCIINKSKIIFFSHHFKTHLAGLSDQTNFIKELLGDISTGETPWFTSAGNRSGTSASGVSK